MRFQKLFLGLSVVSIFGPLMLRGATAAPQVGPIVVPTADYPRPDHPEMGINLETPTNTARSMMYVDAMKSAGGIGPLKPPEEDKPKAGVKIAAKNASKNVAKAPVSKDLEVVVMKDLPVPPGDYLFFCSGQCKVGTTSQKASVTAQDYIAQTNTTTATINVAAGAMTLSLSFSFEGLKDKNGTISEVRLLRPGYPAGTDQIFTKEFLEALKPYRVIRLNTVPLDYGIRLANLMGKDIWINIPQSASDDVVKQIAHLTFDKLNRDRTIYIECAADPVVIPAAATQPDSAKALPKVPQETQGSEAGSVSIAKRSVVISNFFRSTWGPRTINTRVRVVLLAQSANPPLARSEVEAIEQSYGTPSKYIYAVAEAPYLTIDSKLNLGDDLGVDYLFKLLTSSLQTVQDSTLQYQTLARYYRLHHLAYAGGPGLVGEHSFENKNKASRDTRMTPLIEDYLTRWFAQGGELFMYYNLASPYGQYSSWGLTDTINVPSVKTAAIGKILTGPMPAETGGTSVSGIIPAAMFNASSPEIVVKTNTTSGKELIALRADYWFDYLLNVKESGNYRLSFQFSSLKGGGNVEALMSGQSLGMLECPATGDWKKGGTTMPIHLQLEKGQIVLRLKISRPGMNIRSVTLEKDSAAGR